MNDIADESRKVLRELGTGKMSSNAYDTAWVARLGDFDRSLSNQAMEWICENQLPDGSWGARDVFYYHDRVICTLSAMIALTYCGRRARDKHQIEKGLEALERITSGATQGLSADPNGATVGFEMITPTLVAEAEKLGVIKQQGERILGRMKYLRERKMEKLAGLRISRYHTPSFSAEMAGVDGLQILDTENLQEKNGSIGHSPSASAYYALCVKPGDARALDYLRKFCNPEGGFPNLIPFDTFEANWVLWNFSLTPQGGRQTIHDDFQHGLALIRNAWRPGRGIGLSVDYSIPDGDDTLVAHDLLSRYAGAPDIEAVFKFEDTDCFCAYPYEAHRSNSLNIHAIGTLRQAGYDRSSPVIVKVTKHLEKTRTLSGYWFDKWNLSPYYTTSHAVVVCAGYMDELISPSMDWILESQRDDGSWGYQFSTAEETAYCIQALSAWREHTGNGLSDRIDKAASWLIDHIDPPYPSFWMGKALYTPELIVRSTILSALLLAKGGL